MLDTQRNKITPRHLERQAVVYVRQSTYRQVQQHTESTRRQYALRDKAIGLGWPDGEVHVLDSDLGKSGASAEEREDFRTLVGSVAVGEVGIVLGLEVSRLARNNADWHRLLELAAASRTLILDETGIYDPCDLNDRLLLGLKGQFSEIELLHMKARLYGGMLNKARRGELKTRLPVGLVYLPDDSVALDPDPAVGEAVSCVFESFRRLRSATATWRWLADNGVELPGAVHHGPRRGERLWLPPTLSRVLAYLHNPRYAGAYSWGRRSRKDLPATAGPAPSMEDRWQVLLPNSHPGYIDWDRFLANQAILAGNQGQFRRRRPAPRQGCALLQSRVLCGRCGDRMGTHYTSYRPRDNSPSVMHAYYVCRSKRAPSRGGPCQSVSAKRVDAEVARQVVGAVSEDHIAVALAVQEEVRQHAGQAAEVRQERLRQLDYQADLAAQRYYAVDPRNRSVAARLEADWNACLQRVERNRREHERLLEEDRSLLTDAALQRIEGLARDFSRVWDDPRTQTADRKRILGTIVEDVTLLRSPDRCLVQVRFHGGATREAEVPLPCGATRLHEVQPELVARIAGLSEDHTCKEVAAVINAEGFTGYGNRPYTQAGVRRVLRANGLPSRTERLRARGLRTAREVAAELNVSAGTVRKWARLGLLPSETIAKGPQRTHAMYGLPDEASVAEILASKGKWNAGRKAARKNAKVCDNP